jgi:hypothetical protein
MFEKKKNQLFEGTIGPSKKSSFIKEAMKQSATTTSGNMALKYANTDNEFVTQFGSISKYKKQRSYNEISLDCETLWAKNPLLSIVFILYIRMITRIVSLFDGNKTSTVQRGAGLKHESITRMIWLEINHPDSFYKNLHLFISVGSWNDLFQMLKDDITHHGWKYKVLNWNKLGQILLAGLENPNTINIIKKYLPQIKSKSKCITVESQADNMIAKWICNMLYGEKESPHTYKLYRKLKSSGNAHQWQQLISQGKFLNIDFETVHGRALSLMVSSKFIKNHGLEDKYNEWIKTKPIAKFTGYVYELCKGIESMKEYQKKTIDAQYKGLLELAGKTTSNLIVVKDTSTSMNSIAIGTNMSSYHVAKSLSIFMGNLLQGYFHNHYIDFSKVAILRKLPSDKLTECWITEQRLSSADTNLQSVIDLLCSIKIKGIQESEFPKGLLIISDGEFDSVGSRDTNVSAARKMLANVGFSKQFVDSFKFVFWDIRNTFYGYKYSNTKFETYNTEENNVFYFGGFDPSVITFLTGIEGVNKQMPKNALELFDAAMDQEVLNMVQV